MLAWIRETFGKAMIGGIIGFIAFVFVFYGVFSPKSTRGLHEGAVAAVVNGDSISRSEFSREYTRRVEMFKGMIGGKITDDQLKAFRVKENVLRSLVNQKLLMQEAKKRELVASDDQIRESIQQDPNFQKDGKFDVSVYRQVLEANRYSPAAFERLIGDELSVQKWQDYFKKRVHVSEEELKREFVTREDQRNIRYVLLTPESGKKSVAVEDKDIKAFLADPARLNLAKSKFEEGKKTLYPGQKFEAVQDTIARNFLAGEKMGEIQKNNEKLADEVLGLMASASSDAKINSALKSYNLQVKTTGLVSYQKESIPGIGEAKEVLIDAFSPKSPIYLTAGGKPKKYPLAGRILVAAVIEEKKPDLSKLSGQRESLFADLMSQKSKSLFEASLTKLSTQSKIETNAAVVESD